MSTPLSSAAASRSNSTSTATSSTATAINDEPIKTLLARHPHGDESDAELVRNSSRASSPLPLGHYLFMTLSYLAIVLVTAFAITCMFCVFLAIRLLDDMVRTVVPERLWKLARSRLAAVDWPATLSRWSLRLASLAEWEKNRRASLYPSLSKHFAHIDGDRLHAFLFSLTGLLSTYTNRRSSSTGSAASTSSAP